ncbi:hemolysin III family protein, partial [Mycobacterium paragordonae]
MSDHTDAAPWSELSKPIAVVEDVAEPAAEGAVHVLTKPRLRGWIHVYCAGGAVIAGAALVAVSWAVQSRRAGLATLAYVAATVAMFTVSAVYHR